jgi:CHAT domain-containing protein
MFFIFSISHWEVPSEEAKHLATGMFADPAIGASIGSSESLRRSMMALIRDDDDLWMSHPMFWAPFVVVGEGARHQM